MANGPPCTAITDWGGGEVEWEVVPGRKQGVLWDSWFTSPCVIVVFPHDEYSVVPALMTLIHITSLSPSLYREWPGWMPAPGAPLEEGPESDELHRGRYALLSLWQYRGSLYPTQTGESLLHPSSDSLALHNTLNPCLRCKYLHEHNTMLPDQTVGKAPIR